MLSTAVTQDQVSARRLFSFTVPLACCCCCVIVVLVIVCCCCCPGERGQRLPVLQSIFSLVVPLSCCCRCCPGQRGWLVVVPQFLACCGSWFVGGGQQSRLWTIFGQSADSRHWSRLIYGITSVVDSSSFCLQFSSFSRPRREIIH